MQPVEWLQTLKLNYAHKVSLFDLEGVRKLTSNGFFYEVSIYSYMAIKKDKINNKIVYYMHILLHVPQSSYYYAKTLHSFYHLNIQHFHSRSIHSNDSTTSPMFSLLVGLCVLPVVAINSPEL